MPNGPACWHKVFAFEHSDTDAADLNDLGRARGGQLGDR